MLLFIRKIKNQYSNLSVTKKSIIWFTLATIIQNGILFLVTPIYTRILSDDEYGVFSIYQSWQQIISIVSVLALDRCITVGFIKYQEKREEFLSSIQTLMTVLVFVSSLIILLFSDYFTSFIGLPIYIILMMFIVALLNNSLSNWSWLQRYKYNYKKLTFVTIFSTLLMQVVAVLSVLFLPFENKGIVLIMSMSGTRLLIYGIIYLSVLLKGKMGFNKKYWKFGLKYSVAVVPHALSQIILNSSDRIMIDKLCGRADAAYYGVTYSAAMVLNIIVTSISSAVQPWFFEKIKEKNYESIKKQTNTLLLFSACLSVSVSIFAPEILGIMAPSSYKAALWVFPSVAASIYFNSMFLYFSNFESYYEKPVYFSIATTTGAIINIILNYLLLPKFGFVIAGYTTLFSYMLFAIMHYVFMRKICKEKINNEKVFDMKFIVALSVIVLLLTLGVTILYKYTIIRYILIFISLIILFRKRKTVISKIKQIINLKKAAG